MNFKQQMLPYFKPKTFEFYQNGTIYDLVGIKIYKKYLPTTGDIARKRKKITQIKIGSGNVVEELYKYERQTRNYEWRHLIGLLVFILFLIPLTQIGNKKFTFFDWIFLFVLNLCVNLYPIFLQRYNRIRIVKVLRRNRHQSPHDL
jgi:hypothetical protein